jgi:hypothetical protein
MTFKDYLQSKMFWAGVGTIAASVVAFFCKQITPQTLVEGCIAGLTVIFTKSAIVKSGPPK